MRKPIDIIIDIAAQAYSSALRLLATHHTTSDLMGFIKDVGGEIEIFLKKSIYHNQRNRDTFDALISDLSEIGVSEVSVDALHEIRRKYNKAKHETDNTFNSGDLVNVLKVAKESLAELKKLNLGMITEEQNPEFIRVLWIAGWDHFTTGDTEVRIIIPYDENRFPPTLEMFNIHWEGWDKVISKFSTQGTLTMGRDSLPKTAYDHLSSEGDFIEAGVFSGDYREFILEVSQFMNLKNEEKLLPLLQRKNDKLSMYYAVIYAACTVVVDNSFYQDITILEEAIYIELIYKYAASRHSPYIKEYVPLIAELLSALKEDHRTGLEGPFFLSEKKYEVVLSDSYLVHNKFDIAISNDGKLFAKLV